MGRRIPFSVVEGCCQQACALYVISVHSNLSLFDADSGIQSELIYCALAALPNRPDIRTYVPLKCQYIGETEFNAYILPLFYLAP